MSNPYRRVHGLTRRRRGGGWLRALPVLGAAAATPLLRPVLLRALDGGDLAAGTADAALRIGFVVLAVMALHLYTDLVRGPDRPVLDPHPVDAPALLSALALRAARERIDVLLAGLVVLSPVALAGEWAAFAAGGLFVAGTWVACLGVPYAVYLGAVWAARSPRTAAALELVRGDNAPMHAALIYAPGVVAAAVGLPMVWVLVAVEWAIEGWAPGWLWLLLLPALGVAGLLVARPLAARFYVPTTALLTEIDGMYAGVSEAEEARHVYLEWVARGRPELLRALRQAGRRLWPYSVGAWTAGALAALAVWTGAGAGVGWGGFVATGGAVAVSTLPALLAQGDPAWLDKALGVSAARVAVARAVAGVLYAQGVVLPPLLVVFVRGSRTDLAALALAEGLAVVGAAVAAAAAARLGPRGLWVAAPVGLVLWAGALFGDPLLSSAFAASAGASP